MLVLLVRILLGLSTLLGVKSIPMEKTDWVTLKSWTYENGLWKAQFEVPLHKLNYTDDQNLVFPTIVHGAHIIEVDGRLIEKFNDPTMKTVRSFYGSPAVDAQLLKGEKLTWTIYSNTQYFARFPFWPRFQKKSISPNFFEETANVAAFGALFLLALYLFTGITKNLLSDLNISLAVVSLGLSFYFALTVPGLLNLNFNMLTAHRIADINVLLATVGIIKYLSIQRLLPKRFCQVHYVLVVVGLIIILNGQNGDQIQAGTTTPLSTMLISVFIAVKNRIKAIWKSHNYFQPQPLFDLAGLMLFCWAIANDVLCIVGIASHKLVLPLGLVGGCYSFATSLHSWTAEIYREREHLRENLESEVASKTAELRENLDKLKLAQAELVHSAKLASLGTLAAGIAHEINNSINYVNGAIVPLENLIEQNMAAGSGREKTVQLIKIMRDGIGWTVNIVKSLRLYTGLNQAKLKEAKIVDLIQAVTAILSSRIRNKVVVKMNVPPELSIFGNIVGINQILMNLITNSLDAMGEKGLLEITASEKGKNVIIAVRDNGCGIDDKTKEKIFDPFFTTKEVGKGTGLGLHIVMQEVQRHHGKLTFQSKVGQGTTFFIELPKVAETEAGSAA